MVAAWYNEVRFCSVFDIVILFLRLSLLFDIVFVMTTLGLTYIVQVFFLAVCTDIVLSMHPAFLRENGFVGEFFSSWFIYLSE